MCIRWGNTLSSLFSVSNSVKQGGILSPALFNIYMDGLSTSLKYIHYYIMETNHSQCALNPKQSNLKHLFCY